MSKKNQKQRREEFFQKRVGNKLKSLKDYLGRKEFVAFFLAKKQAGKGTYAKILSELTNDKIVHVAVGDLVREAEKKVKDKKTRPEFIKNLKKYYKGDKSLDKVAEEFANQTKSLQLLPTDVVMALIEQAIEKNRGHAIILDGFPRSVEQVAMAAKMQADFGKRGLPSLFVEVNCPREVLKARNVHRRACPICQDPKNIKLLVTDKIEYDKKTGEFHLVCDRPECKGARMVAKQGDIEGMKKREFLQRQVDDVIGEIKNKMPHAHIAIHNSIPVDEAKASHDMTDFTEEAELSWNPTNKEVTKKFKPMIVKDDQGRDAYSRWPEPVVVELIDKLTDWLYQKEKTK